jgi:hypothetical protein
VDRSSYLLLFLSLSVTLSLLLSLSLSLSLSPLTLSFSLSLSLSFSLSFSLSLSSSLIGQVLNYTEEANRGWTDPLTCLSVINSLGIMTTITLQNRENICQTDLLQGYVSSIGTNPNSNSNLQEKVNLYLENSREKSKKTEFCFENTIKNGVMLPNGNCYLLQLSGVVLSASLSRQSTHILNAPLPTRVSTTTTTTPLSCTLYGSVEQDLKITLCQALLKKQQSSMFGGLPVVHSGPADLNKLFAKTLSIKRQQQRTQQYQEEKEEGKRDRPLSLSCPSDSMEEGIDPDPENGNNSPSPKSPKSPKSRKLSLFHVSDSSEDKKEDKKVKERTESVSATMADTMVNLELRGENLKKITVQSEELENSAQVFRDLQKELKGKLEKKKSRWRGSFS